MNIMSDILTKHLNDYLGIEMTKLKEKDNKINLGAGKYGWSLITAGLTGIITNLGISWSEPNLNYINGIIAGIVFGFIAFVITNVPLFSKGFNDWINKKKDNKILFQLNKIQANFNVFDGRITNFHNSTQNIPLASVSKQRENFFKTFSAIDEDILESIGLARGTEYNQTLKEETFDTVNLSHNPFAVLKKFTTKGTIIDKDLLLMFKKFIVSVNNKEYVFYIPK